MCSKIEEALPEPYTRTASEKALTQCNEPGEHHNEVGRQVVRLKMVEIKKIAEKLTRRESEPTLKVREEDNPLASKCLRHDLSAGSAPQDCSRDLADVHQGLDVAGGRLGSLP